ncbi:gpW family head-tail joining protein [Tistrella mobilis]|uniref:gpW family head-tail joining protein n=1 Tax=Tistrella mobilis TaxID=171437 RepID=UPI003557A5EF
MTEDIETARRMLAEAEAALHALMIGQRVVTVAHDGKSVTYTAARAGDLRAWIAELRVKAGQGGGRRAIGVDF